MTIFYGAQVHFGFTFVFIIYKRLVNNLLEIINMKIATQSIFRHLFDNSEESIIIVNNDEVKYVNNQFLEKFKFQIMNSKEQINGYNEQFDNTNKKQVNFIKRIAIELGFI